MQYFNPQTQITISRKDLKTILHASILDGIEEINGWYKLYNGQAPETQHGQSIVPDEIILENGKYVQKFKVIGDPIPEETSLAERVSDLEDALIEIAALLPD